MDIEKILERAGNLKLPGGIFGKLTSAVVVICVCISAIAIAAGNIWIAAGTILLELGFAFYIFSKLLSFAERNPRMAILDGAEFVMHERIVHAAKGVGLIEDETSVEDHTPTMIEDASQHDELHASPESKEGAGNG